MNIKEIQKMMLEGKMSCEELVLQCLKAIKDNDENGVKTNAVAAICPDYLTQAKQLDDYLKRNNTLKGPLHGIPVLVKDNIDIKDMATTASSYALKDNIAQADAPLITELKRNGALILGKSNLSEFAYWMSEENMPSGYGSLNGQVRHALCPGFDPSGSSSGSAVSVSARYTPVSIGSETDGSLMSPSISNAIVSIKPTDGIISKEGILPISHVQDTAGPMSSNVLDCTLALSALTSTDYERFCVNDLSNKVIGIVDYRQEEKPEDYDILLNNLKTAISFTGGSYKTLTLEDKAFDEMDLLTIEFKHDLNQYLKDHHSKCQSLKDIIDFNMNDPKRCLKYGQSLLIKSENSNGDLSDPEYLEKTAIRNKALKIIENTIEDNNLYCFVSIHDFNTSNLAPLSGCPSMVIPAKIADKNDYRPASYYFIGLKNDDGKLINTAYAIEKYLSLDTRPDFVKEDRS